MALHQVLAGSCMAYAVQGLCCAYHLGKALHLVAYMLGTTTTLSMLFQVLRLWLLVHLKEYGLAVTEININFDQKSIETRK